MAAALGRLFGSAAKAAPKAPPAPAIKSLAKGATTKFSPRTNVSGLTEDALKQGKGNLKSTANGKIASQGGNIGSNAAKLDAGELAKAGFTPTQIANIQKSGLSVAQAKQLREAGVKFAPKTFGEILKSPTTIVNGIISVGLGGAVSYYGAQAGQNSAQKSAPPAEANPGATTNQDLNSGANPYFA